jgi:hypothetical protein
MAYPSIFPRVARITLTPGERVFLNSEPDYDRPSLPQEQVTHRAEPSASRRVGSLLLFVAITGFALAILTAAALRALALAVCR